MGRSGIVVYNRITGKTFEEKVYGGSSLRFLYGEVFFSRWVGRPLRNLLSRIPIFSHVYGYWQNCSCTKRKILPFIKKYGIDADEFLSPPNSFVSFNDFFIRKLKPSSRPIVEGDDVLTMPADGRYLFFQNLSQTDGFYVKGMKFDLARFLQDEALAARYHSGSMAIGRLCPVDYHRFHFPCDAVPDQARLINGYLYSVNPIALKRNIAIFSENKRFITRCQSSIFGEFLSIEVGATNVGSIIQTFQPGQKYAKGEEKGYFAFGGSSLVLLFLPGAVQFDADLLAISAKKTEILCLMGQSMGKKTRGKNSG